MLGAALLAVATLAAAKQPPTSAQLAVWRDDLQYSIEFLTDFPSELGITSAPFGNTSSPGRFPSVCTCRPPILGSLTSCGPSHLAVIVAEPGAAGESPAAQARLTQQVREHLGPAWNRRAANFSRHYASAPDHRSPDEVIGTWGGDFGELLLALAVAEERLERAMRASDVTRFIVTYVRTSPAERFFYGTDAAALSFVATACGRDELDPTDVPPPLRERALAAMTDASGLGAGDDMLRWLLTSPEDFGVRRELVVDAVRGFHELLWQPPTPGWRARLRYFVHRRREEMPAPFALLEVMASPDCTKERRTLPVSPLAGHPPTAALVLHPQAAEARRRAAAGLVRQLDQGPFDAAVKGMLSKGADWDGACADKLAAQYPGLPRVQIVAY